MYSNVTDVLTCIEHERLALELLEVRTGGQDLMRLRSLSRERAVVGSALVQLRDHEREHGCSRCGLKEGVLAARRTK